MQGRNLKVKLQGVPAGLHLRRSVAARDLKLVLGGVQRAAGLADLIELENGLNFLGSLGRLDQDEAENFAA